MSVFESRYLGSSVAALPVKTMRVVVQQGQGGNGMCGNGEVMTWRRVRRGRERVEMD